MSFFAPKADILASKGEELESADTTGSGSREAQQLGPSKMGTKMKGLLKGLRYISQIFDAKEEEEEEMQIGFPTDVKHVAHIGWDGPSMSGYQSPSAPANGDSREIIPPPKFAPQGAELGIAGVLDSPARDPQETPLPRPSRRQPSTGGGHGVDSSSRGERDRGDRGDRDASTRGQRQTRRHHSGSGGGGTATDSPEGSRHGRQHRSSSAAAGAGEPECSTMTPLSLLDSPAVPKTSRRRKTKGTTSAGSGGSVRSRPKPFAAAAEPALVSDPGPEDPNAEPLPSALKPFRDDGCI